MQSIHIKDLDGIIHKFHKLSLEQKEYLCNLDAQAGDGDIGITINKGLQAILDALPDTPKESIGSFLIYGGMEMSEHAASTMGTLFSSGLINSGKFFKNQNEISYDQIGMFFEKFIEGIQKRGKASIGDKTILDVLSPASNDINESLKKELELKLIFEKASYVADLEVENTKHLKAVHGRASRYPNGSIGLIDPGAVVGALFIKSFHEYYMD